MSHEHSKKCAEKIRAERKRQGLTQLQLGEKMGVPGSMVGAYETGVRNLNFDMINRFAVALGVSVDSIISGSQADNMVNALYESLNEDGQKKAVEFLEILAECPRFKK